MADIITEGRFAAERRKTRRGRGIFIVFGIVITFLLCEGIFYFALAPNMRIENIIIDNDPPLKREELLSAAGLHGQHYYFRLDVETVKSRLEALPSVKSAWVRKVFPASLRIVARSRQPVAIALAESPSGTIPLAFDEDGVVFLSGREVPETSLPVLSGIRFEDFRAGVRLPEMLKPFLVCLMELEKSSPVLLSAFSEMKIVRKGSGQFEFVLYPLYHHVPVRMEGELDAQRCRMVLIVLDALDREGLLGRVEEIDFRTEDIIYRFKEG
ncbi:MAG: FtsQ-type POTRA domain-containing protein [Spirochaetales bacterium]|jgi:cell division protein FtsQ|nr:FtsQ-type POTRA domain-containing protein [Spirochaetales bacterium]